MASLVFLLLLAAVRSESPVKGILGVALAFFAHSALAIGLAWGAPEATASVLPDGQAYWNAQLRWITTGEDPEYDWLNWVPQHLHLLLGSIVLGAVSFGLLPLVQGVYEVDLMNFYVGRLLDGSVDVTTALFFGWHPWSVLRGLCYLLLVYELSSLSLGWFTKRRLGTLRGHGVRIGAALVFFVADALVKYSMLDLVRDGLASNLRR